MRLLSLQVLRHERHRSNNVKANVEAPKILERAGQKLTLWDAIKKVKQTIQHRRGSIPPLPENKPQTQNFMRKRVGVYFCNGFIRMRVSR